MDKKAYAWWPIEVVEAGRFEVTLMYTCSKENLGAKIEAQVCGEKVDGVVSKVYNPDYIPSPDRVPRKEVYEKVWAPLTLGTIELSKGRTKLLLKAVEIPGKQAPDIKAIRLKRIS